MTPGFSSAAILVTTGDGRNFKLAQAFSYRNKAGSVITVPAETQSDGASTPSFIWAIIPPFGKHWLPAVMHDQLYRNTFLPKDYCDDMFLEAMEVNGVSALERDAIYEAVKFGGRMAFADDRKGK